MKMTSAICFSIALAAPGFAMAQSEATNHGSMSGMQKGPADAKKAVVHHAVGVVRAVDKVKGNVTLAHEAIDSLKWPAMTMRFKVKDGALFDQLGVGKKVTVAFAKQGSDYVIASVK